MKLSNRLFVNLGIVGAVLVLLCANAAIAQARERESKPQRVEQLKGVLSRLDQSIELLSSEPAAQGAREHKQELEHVKKARDAVQRLVNQVEGRDENADVAKDRERNTRTARNRPVGDYYPNLLQVRQDLDEGYTVLSRDPGNDNIHRNNAIKFIQQAREPIARDVEEYARAHPEVVRHAPPAVEAQQAAAQAPANLEAQELHAILDHEDHNVDILTRQPANSPQRSQALEEVTRARDAVQGMIDAVEHGDQRKDVAAEHARDAAAHRQRDYGYYEGLQAIQGYLKNDQITLSRQPEDPAHLRTTASRSMERAQSLVNQAIDAYLKAHPNEKH